MAENNVIEFSRSLSSDINYLITHELGGTSKGIVIRLIHIYVLFS